MDVRVAWVGKGRDRLLGALADRYAARLERYVTLVTAHVPAATGEGRTADEARRLEGERLRHVLERWRRGPEGRRASESARGAEMTVALDERGRMLSSTQLAEELGRARTRGVRAAVFLVGGDEGLDPSLREQATLVLALSPMTFTHELARVLLMEQLYRAHAILAGHPYHRG